MIDVIDRLVQMAEAAWMLGITERTLRWWIQIGKIGSCKNGDPDSPGGRRTIPASEINRVQRETFIPARPEFVKEAAQEKSLSLTARPFPTPENQPLDVTNARPLDKS